MNTQQLSSALADALQQLEGIIVFLTETELNTQPYTGGWTAGQLSEHILLSNASVTMALTASGTIAGREPDQRVPELEGMFLNYAHKFDAAPFLCPPLQQYNVETQLKQLQSSFDSIMEMLPQLSQNEAITIPVLGMLTKTELVHFTLFHTQRHIHQLVAIVKGLRSS